jgi:hypothetical protein
MGSGGGGSTTSSCMTGVGGGRIIPGTDRGPAGQSGLVGSPLYTYSSISVNNISPSLSTIGFGTAYAVQGSAAGDVGKGSSYKIFQGVESTNGSTIIIRPAAGAGGGWGAAGGTYQEYVSGTDTPATTSSYGPVSQNGAAGGKAINTNGHAVTWIGGASRAYGAIG